MVTQQVLSTPTTHPQKKAQFRESLLSNIDILHLLPSNLTIPFYSTFRKIQSIKKFIKTMRLGLISPLVENVRLSFAQHVNIFEIAVFVTLRSILFQPIVCLLLLCYFLSNFQRILRFIANVVHCFQYESRCMLNALSLSRSMINDLK